MYDFTNGTDRSSPYYGGVIGDKSGAFYPVAQSGGGRSGCGAVVRLTPPANALTAWTETTLWNFAGGNDKWSQLHRCSIGLEHYTAWHKLESTNNGTFFKLTPTLGTQTQWTETILYSFAGCSDANYPAGLTVSKGGVIYGVSDYSGSAVDGAVFALTPPKKGQTVWKEQVVELHRGRRLQPAEPTLIIDTAGGLYGAAESADTQTDACDNVGPEPVSNWECMSAF